jgi:hypothetical protein
MPAIVMFHCPTYLCCSEEKQATDFNLSDAEDDFVAAEELAEEAGRARGQEHQCAPNVRKRVWHQRCLGCLDVSDGDGGEAVAAQLLFLPERGAHETWRRGLA